MKKMTTNMEIKETKTKNKRLRGRIFFVGLVAVMALMVSGAVLYTTTPATTQNTPAEALTGFNAEDLARFNGTDANKPIYVGLDGYVYDVTEGKSFYEPGADYNYLTGRDSSEDLHFFGGDIIKRKYPVVGTLQ